MSSLFRKLKTHPQSHAQPEATFSYNTLSKGEVRLLRLRPSDSSSVSASGSLITVQLIDCPNGEIPAYEALSYVWGSELAESYIKLNNLRYGITSNLDAALKVLHKVKTERLLWIDSICINQADIEERNQQARLMKAIYQQAQRVVIWLGVVNKEPAAKVISTFVRHYKQGVAHRFLAQSLDYPYVEIDEMELNVQMYNTRLFADCTELKHGLSPGGFCPELVEFFDKAWFRRVW
jgi:hypothetical protein